jgi:8-oxo-dGTP pyrophosphatase MutT (NUDIX family)
MAISYGSVLFNQVGQVLLRQPSGGFGGYVWTFAKGRPDPGEHPETTALRETFEETGYRGRILVPIPGNFLGSLTRNQYFLMEALEPPSPFGWETSAIRWAEPLLEAPRLLRLSPNRHGRERDLAVLEAAYRLWLGLRSPSPII